ncbi:MAG: UDP-N-acetylmuramate--L-alanine ligase, partial [Gemmatimonadaceae bacterium]|nr:UDP-N-acetylmuramate--L-alanine ligase [Chitinophagaceae bacterium]
GWAYYRDNNYAILKRSDVLEVISAGSFNICIGGTHGKTTITTMVAHLLRHTGFGCNAFLGGISVNYDTNFWSSDNNVSVIEADEYDRSFLKLSPDIAVVSAMDPDHLDIYGTAESLEDAFIAFAGKVRAEGLLLSKFGLKRGRELKAPQQLTYSAQNEAADIHTRNIRMNDGSYHFDLAVDGKLIDKLVLNMGGMHNVENAAAAIAIASRLKIKDDAIRLAIAEFKGVKRRFEYIIKNERLVFVDDYAHHPEELRALITGARSLFNGRKCTIVFQPHLFSRTKDLADDFAASLDLADEIILLPIYPARELPMKGVSSEMIVERMKNKHIAVVAKEKLVEYLKTNFAAKQNREFPELLITAGAGDIDAMVEPIKNILNGN